MFKLSVWFLYSMFKLEPCADRATAADKLPEPPPPTFGRLIAADVP